MEDSTIQSMVQRLGARAEKQTQRRLAELTAEKSPERAATQLAVLLLDGFQVSHRGPGWAKRQTQQPRVEWHDEKLGVFYRQEQAVRSQRGQLAEKVVVSWQGEPLELGRRLHWEALRGGLGRAQATLVVADGAPWIWNVAADRWAGAHELLDFYHASQHLWVLVEALHGKDERARREWAESRLHRLRHGRKGGGLLREGHRTRVILADRDVELAQEIARVEILASAVAVLKTRSRKRELTARSSTVMAPPARSLASMAKPVMLCRVATFVMLPDP